LLKRTNRAFQKYKALQPCSATPAARAKVTEICLFLPFLALFHPKLVFVLHNDKGSFHYFFAQVQPSKFAIDSSIW
jgi:hypothetical protein